MLEVGLVVIVAFDDDPLPPDGVRSLCLYCWQAVASMINTFKKQISLIQTIFINTVTVHRLQLNCNNWRELIVADIKRKETSRDSVTRNARTEKRVLTVHSWHSSKFQSQDWR